MKFNDDYFQELLKTVAEGNDIKLSDIPDIDLYMDQVTTFIDNKLSHLKRDKDDKLLTKTMINNYTKSKILLPSKNKRYNKQHMILLILIYYLKQILSINDINALFAPILKDIATGKPSKFKLEELYSAFLDMKANLTPDNCNTYIENISSARLNISENSGEEREMKELFLTVLMLVTQAYAHKRMAEKIIDDFFMGQEKRG